MLLAAHAIAGVPAAIPQPFQLSASQSCVPDSDDTAAEAWAHGTAVVNAMRAASFVGATSGADVVELSDELDQLPQATPF